MNPRKRNFTVMVMRTLISLFVLFFVSVSIAQTPKPPIPPATKQKLNTIWLAYEKLFTIGDHTIQGFILKNQHPNAAKLKDSKVYQAALVAMGEAFSQKFYETFSEKEIDYLVQLYSSPIAKKLSEAEKDFWQFKVTGPIIKSVLEAPTPAQPKLAPSPAPASPKK